MTLQSVTVHIIYNHSSHYNNKRAFSPQFRIFERYFELSINAHVILIKLLVNIHHRKRFQIAVNQTICCEFERSMRLLYDEQCVEAMFQRKNIPQRGVYQIADRKRFLGRQMTD